MKYLYGLPSIQPTGTVPDPEIWYYLHASQNFLNKEQNLSFHRTQSRVVTGLLSGHNTLRRNLHLIILDQNFLIYEKLGRGRNLRPKRLRWSRGSVLVFGTQVRGFKPGRNRLIFQGEKILSTPSFGGEVKPSVPCRRFTACKRFLNATWKSGISGKILRPFLAHILGSLGRRLVVKVGTSKNNKV